MPKSATLTLPSFKIMMLWGLMSRWIMPRECACSSALAICVEKLQRFSPVEPALLLEILLERNALDELHNNIIEVIRVRHVVHAHNVRVRKHRDGLRLGMEPAAELLILRELLL